MRSEQGQMASLSLHSTIQRNTEIIGAGAGEELVMVSIENGHYYGLSKIAKEIWQMIEQPLKVSDLVASLVAKYEVDADSCEKDTLKFLEQLEAENLLWVRNVSSS